MSLEFRAIADSKFVRVISLLDGVNPDQWTDQNREDFETSASRSKHKSFG